MPFCGASLARSPLDPLVTDFRRLGRGPDIPRRLLQSRWIPSTYRGALRSPITLRAVSRSDGSRRLARCRGSSPLRVAPPSALFTPREDASRTSGGQGRTSNAVQEHLRDRSREEPLPRPVGARDTSCRRPAVSRVGAREGPFGRPRAARRVVPAKEDALHRTRSAFHPRTPPKGRRVGERALQPSAPLLPCPSRAFDCARVDDGSMSAGAGR